MKFKDSPNWGKRKKFYGQEAIDIISAFICCKSPHIDFISIQYGAGDSKMCESAEEALNFLAEMDLEDVWMLGIWGTDHSCATILGYKNSYMKDYITFEFSEYYTLDENDEEYLSKRSAKELRDKGILDQFEVGTFEGLRQIHQYIFLDGGEIRNVNLTKGNFRFTPSLFLEKNLKIIEDMPENTFDEIIEKYVEMNVAHPFKDGNGRATRIWLNLMLKKNLKMCIDWQKINKIGYLQAMERSPVNPLELKYLLKNALTENVNDRDIYMKGIQKSFEYEGQDSYNIYNIK